MKKFIWLLAIVALIVSVYAEDEIVVERAEFKHWNQFRGPNGNGQVMGKELPIEFSETKNLRWKTSIHDDGYSSKWCLIVITDKRLMLMFRMNVPS